MEIRVGTSGFSYDDWRGFFYPEKLPRGRMLEAYSRAFTTVEINSSYYRIPPPLTMARMAEKTPAGFDFSVKAYGGITHAEQIDPAACLQFRLALQPLIEQSRLGVVLAQFPYSFRESAQNREQLQRLRDLLESLPLVVEFRNASWAIPETLELLRELEAGYCCVDEPRLRGLMPPQSEVTSSTAYFRFHGRNAAKWWRHDHPAERYNYLYSGEELQEWLPAILDAAPRAAATYIYFNNHYQGKAAHNAREMANLLREAVPDPSAVPLTPEGEPAEERQARLDF